MTHLVRVHYSNANKQRCCFEGLSVLCINAAETVQYSCIILPSGGDLSTRHFCLISKSTYLMHGKEVVEDTLQFIILHTMILEYNSTDHLTVTMFYFLYTLNPDRHRLFISAQSYHNCVCKTSNMLLYWKVHVMI